MVLHFQGQRSRMRVRNEYLLGHVQPSALIGSFSHRTRQGLLELGSTKAISRVAWTNIGTQAHAALSRAWYLCEKIGRGDRTRINSQTYFQHDAGQWMAPKAPESDGSPTNRAQTERALQAMIRSWSIARPSLRRLERSKTSSVPWFVPTRRRVFLAQDCCFLGKGSGVRP
jgi:hypothetical protein